MVTNLGIITWSGTSDIYFAAGLVYNQPGATFDVQNNQQIANIAGGNPSFQNAGVFRKSAGSGTTTIGIPFNNTGLVKVQSGTLSFQGGGTLGGSFAAAAGAAVNFAGGTFALGGGGVVSGGAGQVLFTGGQITFTGPITNFSMTGGTLGGTNVVTGTLNWTGGTISGALTVASTGVLNIGGSAIKSISSGIVTKPRHGDLGGNGVYVVCLRGDIQSGRGLGGHSERPDH